MFSYIKVTGQFSDKSAHSQSSRGLVILPKWLTQN